MLGDQDQRQLGFTDDSLVAREVLRSRAREAAERIRARDRGAATSSSGNA